MSAARTTAGQRPRDGDVRPVSRPHDPHEREAESAADVVVRGGSVADWSFSAVPASQPAPVQRQEAGKEKAEEEDKKKKETLKKAGEAALETPQGQALKEKVLADPLVKTVTDAATSTPGIIATGVAAAGGVAALAATGKELPFQAPAIPLDKVTPGLSAQVTYEGPVNAPTFVGLSISYKEQGPKTGAKKKDDPIASDIARLKAQQELFKPQAQKQAEKQQEAELVAAWIAQQKLPAITIPLQAETPKKEEEKKPAQPAPASPSAAPPEHAAVDGALSGSGWPLASSARRTMEARFGHDFSRVRVHDDARAAAAAESIDAAAFTAGEDVAFAPGRYDPQSEPGRRLLAHELAHVVQQSDERDGRAGAPALADPQGAGRPLDAQLRDHFEPRLGIDLGETRLHTGADAADAAASEGARAYTVGSDIVFGKGQFSPGTRAGRWLLAHELAHLAQARRSAGDGGMAAVERDASEAASAALTGRPVRIGARRSAGARSAFGEPQATPDLTFVSTHGGQGFLRQATQYHQTWSLSPQRFSSLQALLGTLAGGSGTISRLRIVSHADFDNIFTPLFDGGAAGITEADLLAWGESDVAGLRRVLQAPLVTGPLRDQILTSAQAANPAAFQALGVDPANAPTTGPLSQLLDASVDLATIRGAEGLPAAQRATFDRALTQELDALRAQVLRQFSAAGSTATDAQVRALQDAITGLIVVTTIPAQHQQVMSRITRASDAVANGFRASLEAVRGRLTTSSWIDIRGCRVGQRSDYLTAVATFFGTGTSRPHVSAPDLWQSFPRLGWQAVPENAITRRAGEGNVRTALDHWADVTGVRSRLQWWRQFLLRVLSDETQRSLEEMQPLLTPPGLLGGLRLTTDPLFLDFSGDLPPSRPLEQPSFGAGVGYAPSRVPTLGAELRLANPLVPLAERDLALYGGDAGLFRYYLDAGLPLPAQEGANVELMTLIFKDGRERDAIDAWTASEWGPAAPGLTAVQSGSWRRDEIRQVEAVVSLDERRRATEMYVSPDPRYAAHIQTS